MRSRTIAVMMRRPAEGPIAETKLAKKHPVERVPPIDNRFPAHRFSNKNPVQVVIFLPLSGEEDGISSVKRRIGVLAVLDIGKHTAGVYKGERVVCAHDDAFRQQMLGNAKRRRASHIIGIWFEGEP